MAFPSDPNTGYDRITRWLHFGLMTTVTYQLFISLVMEHPKPTRPLDATQNLIFESHEWVGVTAFVVVVLHLVWSFIGPEPIRWRQMFPLRKPGHQAIAADIRQIARLRLPWRAGHTGLAALAHGLGLLTVTGSGLTGFILFVGMPENGALTPLLRNDMAFHSFIANFTWAYWIGHVALAVLHQLNGHPVFQKIRPR